jgi:hypothetical protein
MRKELKYLLYISTIFGFFIFVGNYYFSDENIKKSYKSTKVYANEIIEYSSNLHILKSDTEDIIEYVGNTLNIDEKKYRFWELLINNEK